MQIIKRQLAAALAGESVYTREPRHALSEGAIARLRVALGAGQLSPVTSTQLRWYPADVETAMHMCDRGDISMASRLWRASQHDGIVRGVLSTRTDGLVRLPRTFKGDQRMIDELQSGADSVRAQFDELAPPSELAALARDALGVGIAVGELLPVRGRTFPVLCRLEPEFLRWRNDENRWYYRSNIGDQPIYPGDGRWVLHSAGGRVNPWHAGLWAAVGESWIHKTHARAYDNNWQSKLANPARVAVSPQGASEEIAQSWFQAVMAWGLNSVFGAPPGHDVKLLESNGRGFESFDKAQTRADRENVIAIAGQEVTTDGGSGFQNNDIHAAIRADLIQATADALAYTVNTQVLPPWIVCMYGEAALNNPVVMAWDTKPPADRKALGDGYRTAGLAIDALDAALTKHGWITDVEKVCATLGIPARRDEAGALAMDALLAAAAESAGAEESEA